MYFFVYYVLYFRTVHFLLFLSVLFATKLSSPNVTKIFARIPFLETLRYKKYYAKV